MNKVLRNRFFALTIDALVLLSSGSCFALCGESSPSSLEESDLQIEVEALLFVPIPLIPPCLQCRFTCRAAELKGAECADVNQTPPNELDDCLAQAAVLFGSCFTCRSTVGEC